MSLPKIELEHSAGRSSLAAIHNQQALLVILLRHFGCPVCREQLLTVADIYPRLAELGVQVIGVGQGSADVAEAFEQSLSLPYRVYGDEDNQLYSYLSMPRGSWWQVTLGPLLRQPIQGLKRMRHVKAPGRDVKQLGGVALFKASGELSWCYRQSDSADTPSQDMVLHHVIEAL